MNGDGVVAGADLDEELCKMFEFGDEVVVNLLDVEKDILDYFNFLGLVELFEEEVHTLRVVDEYFLEDLVHVFLLVLRRVELLHVGQPEHMYKIL